MAEARLPYVTVEGVTIPPWNTVVPLTVTVGRSDPTGQPNSNALSFTYWGQTLPSYLHRGALVTVRLAPSDPDVWSDVWDDIWQGSLTLIDLPFPKDNWDDIWADVWLGQPWVEGGRQRFAGKITDITVTPDPPNGTVMAQVSCIGTLTDLADQVIGDEPWPVETDRDRIARVLDLMKFRYPFVNEGSPVLMLRRRDVDRRKVLELLHLFAGSVGSIVWEYPDGSVNYVSYDRRGVPDAAVYLPAKAILSSAQWAQSASQLIDRVRVEYGPDAESGNRPEYVAGDGYYEQKFSGEAADIGTATIIGDTVLARWGRTDVWGAPEVTTQARLLDEATYDQLLSLLPSDPLATGNLTQVPSPANSGEGLWFVEGWTETWDRSGRDLEHEFQFAVSDVRLFATTGEERKIVLTVTPSSWQFGVPGAYAVVMVTMADGGYLPDDGFLFLSADGNNEPVPPFNLADFPPGLSRVEWWLYSHVLHPNMPHSLVATYSGWANELRPTTSNEVQVNAAWFYFGYAVTLSVPTLTPRVGDDLRMDAMVSYGAAPGYPTDGMIYWEVSNDLVVWHGYMGVDVTAPAPAKVSVVWENVHQNDPITYWRCSWIPPEDAADQTRYYSNIIAVRPQAQTYRTLTYQTDGQTTYDGNWQATADTDLRQGDWGDGAGDHRALIHFPIGEDWNGYTVTKVELWLRNSEFDNGEGGTVRVGSYAGTRIVHRTDVGQWAQGTGRWLDITAWGQVLTDGRADGVALGPADHPDSFYAALMNGTTDPPQLRVTGFIWKVHDAALQEDA